ncbi:MAG TPA: hypothetical protein VHE12_10515 [bacterium]|nr:hypothetical protein [bacterium]
MKFHFILTLLFLGTLSPAEADFGNWFVVDQRVPHRLDSPDQRISFRFTCPEDITLTAAAVYCDQASHPPAYTLSIQGDDHGLPSGQDLSRQDLVPSPERWMTVPLDTAPLIRGQVYHLVLRADLYRGGDHQVNPCDKDHYASFASTTPLNAFRPGDGSPDPMANTLLLAKDRWVKKDQQPLYALFGLGNRFQGNPYDQSGSQPIYGMGPDGDKAHARWSGQSLHFHCGFQAQALAIRVRKVGHPKTPLRYVILKNEFRIHRCVAMAEGTALEADRSSVRYQWVTIGWKGLAAANFSPECWFLSLRTDSGRASSSYPEGCEDCYVISDVGNSGGLARADALSFDGGPHLSREVYNDQGGAGDLWQDIFERDANLGALGAVCPEAPDFQARPIPTPFDLDHLEGTLP